jgi:hypothetical protein
MPIMMKKLMVISFIFLFARLGLAQSTGAEEKYRWISIQKDERYGFIDSTGKEIVKPIYDQIFGFDEYKKGWALVLKNEQYGFIDSTGKEVVKPKYDIIYPFDEQKKGWALILKNELCGFIDANGKEVVAPKYESIQEILSKED